MIVIPSLDLMGGKVVRLDGGGPDAKPTVVDDDPLNCARKLRQQGAVFLHLTDLDAAFGRGDNVAVLERLASDLIGFQVGGGIRSRETAERYLKAGADRIVLGTLAVEDRATTAALVERWGMRVMAALDVGGGKLLVRGRTVASETPLGTVAAALHECGVAQVILTPVGAKAQDEIPELKVVVDAFQGSVYLGIEMHAVDDVARLATLTERGLTGVILARAMHEDALDLADVFARA
jgi:phosphoribosylformimino-5-aminoimidazole carboxamide ribonucleotide (ProFAR) isomerase